MSRRLRISGYELLGGSMEPVLLTRRDGWLLWECTVIVAGSHSKMFVAFTRKRVEAKARRHLIRKGFAV